VTSYSKKNRADKLRTDRILDDPDDAKTALDIYSGIIPRLTELIKWARWSCYLLAILAGMVALFFLRDALSVIIGLF